MYLEQRLNLDRIKRFLSLVQLKTENNFHFIEVSAFLKLLKLIFHLQINK